MVQKIAPYKLIVVFYNTTYSLKTKNLQNKINNAKQIKRTNDEVGQILITKRNNPQRAAVLSALDISSINIITDNSSKLNPYVNKKIRFMLKCKQKNTKDVEYILSHLRKEDLEELKALWGENWKSETLKNIMTTDFLCLVGVSDTPVAMGGIWGVGGENSKIACVWLLSTEDVKFHKISLIKNLSEQIKKAEKEYSVFYNFIYKSNLSAKKWLRTLGFKFDKPRPNGINVPEGFEFFYKVNNKE